MKTYFNYAHKQCYNTRKKATEAAKLYGNFDQYYELEFGDIEPAFYEKHKTILDNPKGAGMWMWKFYLAHKILFNDCGMSKSIPENSYIFYGDSDLYFIDKVDYLIDTLKKDEYNTSLMFFRSPNPYKNKLQCKIDAFILTNTDTEDIKESTCRGGGLWLFKKDDISRKFFDEALIYATDRRVIDSSFNNTLGNNPENFIRHAEDEALITLMAKKYKLYPYRWPCQTKEEWYTKRNNDVKQNKLIYTDFEYPNLIQGKSDYPKILNHFQIHE